MYRWFWQSGGRWSIVTFATSKMGKVWWGTRKRTGIWSGRIVERAITTWTWSLAIKAMMSSTGRSGVVVSAIFTTNGWRGLLYYRDCIRSRNAPEVGRTWWLRCSASIASIAVSSVITLTTATAQLLWTVIVEEPLSITAVSTTSVVRVCHLGLLLFFHFFSCSSEHSLWRISQLFTGTIPCLKLLSHFIIKLLNINYIYFVFSIILLQLMITVFF